VSSSAEGKGRAAGRPGLLAASFGGLVAGLVAIAIGELFGAAVRGAPSLVGTFVTALLPWATGRIPFGLATYRETETAVRLYLAVTSTVLVVAVVGGLAGRRSPPAGVAVLGALGIAAVAAAVASGPEPGRIALAVVDAVVATGAAVVTLLALLRIAPRRAPAGSGGDLDAEPVGWDDEGPASPSRRRFVVAAAAIGVGSLFIGTLGAAVQVVRSRYRPTFLPPVTEPAAPLQPENMLFVPGITPIVTPAERFFQVDMSIAYPRIDLDEYRLRVTGLVDRPLTLTWQDICARPIFEQYVTLECVGNPLGGPLIGNGLWTGIHLKRLLVEAGVRDGATQVVGRSIDKFNAAFPLKWALDPAREPMIAIGLNGAPLTAGHGYPARLIVPGLFGYVSATKWLNEIELTGPEFVGTYPPMGWSKEGPVITESRIDHPADRTVIEAGQVEIVGVAWAPDRGVEMVEVQVDDGPWRPAAMSRPISRAAWVQWHIRWDARTGGHTIRARATDGTGAVQIDVVELIQPGGATGYPTSRIQVV
jgi:DMSO/TMAO reductase YedYZ molybdopterin-dependent catalytic subunit